MREFRLSQIEKQCFFLRRSLSRLAIVEYCGINFLKNPDNPRKLCMCLRVFGSGNFKTAFVFSDDGYSFSFSMICPRNSIRRFNNWHFFLLISNPYSSALCSTNLSLSTASFSFFAGIIKSSIYGSAIPCTVMSWNIVFIKRWKTAGELQRPNGTLRNWYCPS